MYGQWNANVLHYCWFTICQHLESLNDKLIEDGITQQTYEDNSANGGGVIGGWRADGDWLTVRPNCNNQFYLLQLDASLIPDARRTLSVKAYFRPRRLTL